MILRSNFDFTGKASPKTVNCLNVTVMYALENVDLSGNPTTNHFSYINEHSNVSPSITRQQPIANKCIAALSSDQQTLRKPHTLTPFAKK